MKKKWSILLTANLLSALVSPLMVHAVTPTTESEEILKNISQTSQTYASESIAQSDAIKQTLKNIQETYDTQKNTDDISSTEETTDTTSTTLSEESTQPTEKEMTESAASNKNIQKVSARSAIQPRAARATQSGTWGSVTWNFNSSDGILTFTSGGTLGSYKQSPWKTGGKVNSEAIKKIVFTQTVKAPTNSQYLFSGDADSNNYLYYCESIEGIEKVDVSSVTNMYGMFSYMTSLSSLDLSSWNVSKVTDMQWMFEALFVNSKSEIRELNISSFVLRANRPDKDSMFKNANFNKITIGSTFDVHVTDTVDPGFLQNSHWYDESGKDVGSSIKVKPTFLDYVSSGHPGTYTTYKPDPVPEVVKWGTVPYQFDKNTGVLTFVDTGTFSEAKESPWNRSTTDKGYVSALDIKKIVFTKSVNAPVNSKDLFSRSSSDKSYLENLESIEHLNYLNTSNVTSMDSFFSGLYNVKTLDLSNMDTRKVTTMHGMFYHNRSLTELNLNYSNFDTSNVTTMMQMFSNTRSLKTLNLNTATFKTTKVEKMNRMFEGMSNLTSLDITNFNTSNVQTMEGMFSGLSALPTLSINNFDTKNVTDISSMFYGMKSLKSLDVSNMNTSKVTNTSFTFASMTGINKLNLGNFDFTKVTNKGSMFLDDTLKEITLPSTFSDTENTTKLNNVPTDDTYNGNWVNINNKSKKLGQTKDFLVNEAGKAGTYVWGEKAEDVLKWGEVPYTFDESTGKLTFIDGGTLGDYTVSPWNRTDGKAISASAVKTIEFTKPVKTPANSSYLFSDKNSNKLSQLTNFSGINNIDTTNATDMSYMFSGMSGITNLDLSGFNTSSVTKMYAMFIDMAKLNKLTIASFDTSKVTNTAFMFSNCNALEEIQLPKFSNVTYAVSMFANMSALTKLDLSGFDFSKIAEGKKNSMFSNDTLKEITLPSTFSDTSNNTKLNPVPKKDGYNGQWQNSNGKLVGQTDKFLQNYNGITDAGTYTWGKYLTWGDVPYEFDESTGTLTFVDGGTLADYTKSPWNRTDGKAISASAVKTIEFTKSVKTLADSSYLFSDKNSNKLTQLTNFSGINNIDTTNATDMSYMFAGVSNLKSLDVSSFKTLNTTNMSYMFQGMSNLTSLNVSSFDTSNVRDMNSMFYQDDNLTMLTFGDKFDTKNVTNMYRMFRNVELLTTLDLSSFDTSQVTNMSEMFSSMVNLKELNIKSFDTRNVQLMKNMFQTDESLEELDISSFNTSKVTSMYAMFDGMSTVSKLDVSNFDTSNVKDMTKMFSGMTKISSLSLSNFDFSSVSSKSNMFLGDTLHEITLPTTFSDPNNTTKLNDVPTTDGYNGNWVNIENKNVNLGQTSDFLKNTAGKAGTYIWGRQSALHLVKVPDLYDFGSKNAVKDITQIIKPTTSDIKNVEIRDDREQKSSWSLSVQASQLESDKLDNLGRARYQFDITSTTDANLPINGIDYVNKKVVLPTDNSSQILYSVTDDNQSPTSYNTWINDMKLIVPENTGKPNEQYEGTITWSLDLTPKD
ncbi:hypothetical protein BW731_05050 [Vagococcus martis]|uniref:WxL domain-containing protein n=1 Tax=Vagococcus martis TaxID=1768210 RepID=A0A1V4DGI9_9ENTE|nr:BspA family leucine-rich repeat surface protein [Vagococcus martis]OPF87618.1 hypothetical protein BW731_05050 [Vagococcus martis]